MDKFISYCLALVSFFMYSGFHAIIALTIAFLGADASRLVSIPIRLLTTAGMIIIIAYWWFHKKRVFKGNIFYLLFICFWMFYFIKVLWHFSNGHPLRLSWAEYIFYALNFCILPFLAFSYIPFDKYKKTIIRSMIFSGFLMGIATVYLYKDILGSGIGRISLARYSNPGLETLNPLSLSYASVLTIMLCVYELLYNQSKNKLYTVYMYVTISLSFVMFLLGASRGSVLALLISIAFLVYSSPRKIKMKSYALIAFSVPFLLWGVAKTGSEVFSRSAGSLKSGSTGREKLWMDAWNEFSNFPFVGGRIEIGYYPHNFILEVMMAMGVVGLLIFLPLLFSGLKKTISLPKVDKNYIWVSILLLQGVCQYLFSASLYMSTLFFFPLGILFQTELSRFNNTVN
ncbi:O-antigen ligase family protein [Ulvibacterium marinum]|uniref:O-antigen ligase domain-containing protein n=1 Tax=Ulvibacterium marinum TaxID=2419782 RepID=A0A3B0BZZ1_9FLAO|nr:O-antigen ligase family protein [Ulvibacterium marinum]RKN76946.1 O-antigen ligase domain-containing protein [Ulvibacterium marinum]